MLFLVGLLVNRIGHAWINVLMPPVVTGAIVMLIGLNLAPVAVRKCDQQLGYRVADHRRHRRDRRDAQRAFSGASRFSSGVVIAGSSLALTGTGSTRS